MSARDLLGNWNIRRDSDSLRRLLFDGGENAGPGKKAKRNRVISRGDGGSPMVTVL